MYLVHVSSKLRVVFFYSNVTLGSCPMGEVPKWLVLFTCIARVTSHVGGGPFCYKVERKRPAGHLGMATGPLGMHHHLGGRAVPPVFKLCPM